jgi:hypothetical protein
MGTLEEKRRASGIDEAWKYDLIVVGNLLDLFW